MTSSMDQLHSNDLYIPGSLVPRAPFLGGPLPRDRSLLWGLLDRLGKWVKSLPFAQRRPDKTKPEGSSLIQRKAAPVASLH